MAGNNFAFVFSSMEKFNGKQESASWFRNFDRCCILTQKTEENVKAQLLMLCLNGQALAVAEQFEQENNAGQTFTALKNRLEEVFNTSANKERRMVEFENRVQKIDETEDEFMLALLKLYKSANPGVNNEELQRSVKRKFMNGISAELKRAIYIFVNDPHDDLVSYQDLLEYGRQARLNILESRKSVSSSYIPPMSSTSESVPNNSDVLNAITELTKTFNSRLDVVENRCDEFQRQEVNTFRRGGYSRGRGRGNNQRGGNNGKRPITCYKCGGLNHVARNCISKN